MNRIALHQSTVHPLDPVQVVGIARSAGLDSIGLRVAAVDEVGAWWAKGIGSPMLGDLAEALLESRVTVLDVGRVELGAGLRVLDGQQPYMRVLELGVRLGAQFVTSRASAGDASKARELFELLAELAGRFRMRPLMTAVPGSAVPTVEEAVAVVAGTPGGVVLDVPAGRYDAGALADLVVELGDTLGYVRLPARDLELGGLAPGLLATLPPQIPVAIGGEMPGGHAGDVDADHVRRVRVLRTAVDALLRHPQASADR
ncbi:hypothetical protein [Pseudonocardia sp.]|uniref:hypothetical protein n=1 Tax=Pseudonocardia sp. TaxID=60912 RepID=UPI003D13724A